jgi:hypothetical protein
MNEFPTETVYGAESIGRVIGVFDDGKVNRRRVHYMLEKGQVPGARKAGRIWMLSIPAWRKAVHGEAA